MKDRRRKKESELAKPWATVAVPRDYHDRWKAIAAEYQLTKVDLFKVIVENFESGNFSLD